MRKGIIGLCAAAAIAAASLAFADKTPAVFKAGEEIYACGCKEGCGCKTMARKEGNCTCGMPMVKAKVQKAEGEKLILTVKGKEQSFPNKAKFACGCGEACKCGTVSQKPGNCVCGKPMKEA
jgi:hypothetical protein